MNEIEVREPVSEKMLRDAKTGALLTPRHRPTRIFYIGVGNMPPARAAVHVENVMQSFKDKIDDFNYENFFLAVQEGPNRIEVIYPPVASAPAKKTRRWWKLRWPRAG